MYSFILRRLKVAGSLLDAARIAGSSFAAFQIENAATNGPASPPPGPAGGKSVGGISTFPSQAVAESATESTSGTDR